MSKPSMAAIAFSLAIVWGSAPLASPAAAADGEAVAPVAPVAAGRSWSFEGTGSYHAVARPYFGTADRGDGWGEGFSRLRANYGGAAGLWFSVGGVAMGTAGKDYYGTRNVGDGRLDQLLVGVASVGQSGVSVVAGRQDLVLGDGFLVGDGFRDTRAALWNIPLNFYDAIRVGWAGHHLHALGFGANLSRSFGGDGAYPRGVIAGGELGFRPAATADLAGTYLRRIDDGDTHLDATAYSLRGSWALGRATIVGEGVLEGGDRAGVTQAGSGGHLRVEIAGKGRFSPAGKIDLFRFSGDDPATRENEAYDPWQLRWSDWSQYYVGDLLASTVTTSTNMRIVCAQIGLAPREGTGVRFLAHRMDRSRTAGPAAFANEFDVVVDQAFGAHWTAWVMGGYSTPLAAARAEYGLDDSAQVFASASWKFGGPGGGSGD